MSLTFSLFELGYLCSKLLAIAILGSVSPITCGMARGRAHNTFAVRVAIGNWRFYDDVGDRASFSLLMHLGEGLLMLAAPFPICALHSSSRRACTRLPRARRCNTLMIALAYA